MWAGINDDIIISLSTQERNLKSISLRVPSDFSLPTLVSSPWWLTDESLNATAHNCFMLESVTVSFSSGEFPFPTFTLTGIPTVIQRCSIRVLALDDVYFFNAVGMEALCLACHLDTLELTKCQEISDDSLVLAVNFPSLKALKLSRCLAVTDVGLKPLVGSQRLDMLTVEDCPQVSEKGVHGGAKFVSYKQDLSWMY